MFLDASAMVAILVREEDGAALQARLAAAAPAYTSAIAIYETAMGIARIRNTSVLDAERIVRRFLAAAQAEVVPITDEIGSAALHVFERFGRGRHPARLNMGDCFAYASARILGVRLLFKGGDFALTDIPAA